MSAAPLLDACSELLRAVLRFDKVTAHVTEGDEAILFGPGTSGEPTAQNWADLLGTIHYEVVTSPRGRVLRTFTGNGDDGR